MIVYVVVAEYHTDCYKRAETTFEVLGVFTDIEHASQIALIHEMNECKYYVDYRKVEWNKCVDELNNQTNSWEEAFTLFNPEQWYEKAEFTMKSSGVRCYIHDYTVTEDDEIVSKYIALKLMTLTK